MPGKLNVETLGTELTVHDFENVYSSIRYINNYAVLQCSAGWAVQCRAVMRCSRLQTLDTAAAVQCVQCSVVQRAACSASAAWPPHTTLHYTHWLSGNDITHLRWAVLNF